MSNSFKTSIRVEDSVFGAVVGRDGDLMISLDGTFIEGSIVLKISQENWSLLKSAVHDATIEHLKRKLIGKAI